MTFLKPRAKEVVTLPRTGSWPETKHELSDRDIWAINAAIAAKRPLLLKGKPGTGKSHLARAAAAAMKRVFLSFVVRAGSESNDLLYHYDPVQRLAEAQIAAVRASALPCFQTNREAAKGESSINHQDSVDSILEHIHPARFTEPGVLWWAFNWANAEEQRGQCQTACLQPALPENQQKLSSKELMAKGFVVLIDEIDKADADFPNGLLEVLGNGSFGVPHLQDAVQAGDIFPLVVITTNEDRALPPAFLRRCLIHYMDLPETKDSFIKLMIRRAEIHFPNRFSKEILLTSAQMFWDDREASRTMGGLKPGQAEWIDFLHGLDCLGKAQGQSDEGVLEDIRRYSLAKHQRPNPDQQVDGKAIETQAESSIDGNEA